MGKKPQIDRRILRELLNGEKPTGELCSALGYVSSRGIPLYKNIEKNLKNLCKEKIISRKKRKGSIGAPKTYWKISLEIGAVKKILYDYPELKDDVIKNKDFLEKVLSKNYPRLFKLSQNQLGNWCSSLPTFFGSILCTTEDEFLDRAKNVFENDEVDFVVLSNIYDFFKVVDYLRGDYISDGSVTYNLAISAWDEK